jgi:hypothetical protein
VQKRVADVPTCQPTLRRATVSVTNAAQTNPTRAWTRVKSTPHSAPGRVTLNSRLTLSGGHGALALPTAGIVLFPCLVPAG